MPEPTRLDGNTSGDNTSTHPVAEESMEERGQAAFASEASQGAFALDAKLVRESFDSEAASAQSELVSDAEVEVKPASIDHDIDWAAPPAEHEAHYLGPNSASDCDGYAGPSNPHPDID
jgi:hypothetical protein